MQHDHHQRQCHTCHSQCHYHTLRRDCKWVLGALSSLFLAEYFALHLLHILLYILRTSLNSTFTFYLHIMLDKCIDLKCEILPAKTDLTSVNWWLTRGPIFLFKDKNQVHCLLARKKSRATRKSTFEVKHPTALVQCEHRFGSKCILLGRNIIYDHHEEPSSVKFMGKMKTLSAHFNVFVTKTN